MRPLRRNIRRAICRLLRRTLRFCPLLRLMKLSCKGLKIRNTEQPVREHRNEDVECNERKYDAKVAPAIAVGNRHRCEKLVAIGERAVFAGGCSAGVLNRAAGSGCVVLQVSAACLSGRRIEDRDFAVATYDVTPG